MDELLAIALVAGCLTTVLVFLAWLAARVRRRGIGDNVMGPFEEIWHPAAHRFRAEIRVHDERVVPLPSAGDPKQRGDRARGPR
ncbi:hypothetical protein O7602_05865 [Micromonospora sp. WMMD1128]|uniref:hypothetical protein n=1 Tax=unclassified Micromonospora TaxID=2617518 RepID=UPI00248AE8AC|nr:MULTISPECIES: hypothetical protein [unclassified Micromonospora]WBB75053.1 hypothetical protein O7602_05865 [Micromonospora sp. WMMD1128]WFE31573.1 hypothetical protein O7613_18330 [Micromonospora sp. WMMD975]